MNVFAASVVSRENAVCRRVQDVPRCLHALTAGAARSYLAGFIPRQREGCWPLYLFICTTYAGLRPFRPSVVAKGQRPGLVLPGDGLVPA